MRSWFRVRHCMPDGSVVIRQHEHDRVPVNVVAELADKYVGHWVDPADPACLTLHRFAPERGEWIDEPLPEPTPDRLRAWAPCVGAGSGGVLVQDDPAKMPWSTTTRVPGNKLT